MPKKLILAFGITLVTLLLCETGLRLYGFKPGIVMPVSAVKDSYYAFPEQPARTYEFVVDSEGIFRYNKQYVDTCKAGYNDAVFSYLKNTKLNEFGFRDVNKSNDTSGKKKIMLLGDSFTWGFTAQPVDSSFANVLADKGYYVYNLGAPGTDVVQYATLAQKYMEQVKPGVVVVNFYYANDFVYYDKHTSPYDYVDFWPSNIGWLPKVNLEGSADSVEVFNTWQDSRNYLLNNLTFGKYSSNGFKRFLSKSVILTYLGKLCYGKENLPVNTTRYVKHDVTATYLRNIQNACNKAGCKLLVTIIPDKSMLDFEKMEEKLATSLAGVNYVTYKAKRTDYFAEVDVHFNNSGHYNYAMFIDSLLRQ